MGQKDGSAALGGTVAQRGHEPDTWRAHLFMYPRGQTCLRTEVQLDVVLAHELVRVELIEGTTSFLVLAQTTS